MDSESEDKMDKEYGPYDEYQVEGWAKTLEEAEEIKADPEKLKYVKQCMEEKLNNVNKAISSLDELKKVIKEKEMKA